MRTRLFYLDDSGAGHTGYAVYAWITCTTSAWTAGLTAWLQFRRSLEDEHGIPPDHELHRDDSTGPGTTIFFDRVIPTQGRSSCDAQMESGPVDPERSGGSASHPL